MKPDPKITAVARPIRYAYLIEHVSNVDLWLNAIFNECYSRDGGRQTLLVPVVDKKISENYLQWLKFLDPDYIYILASNPSDLIAAINKDFSCSTIIELKVNEEVHLKNTNDIKGLTSLSWIPFLKTVRDRYQSKPAPEFILDQDLNWKDDGFVIDNFGVLQNACDRWPSHEDLGLKSFMLTPDPKQVENSLNFQNDGSIASSLEYDFFEFLTNNNSVLTLSYLSNLCTNSPDSQHNWTKGFCLVVGDEFEDRLSCWNAGLLFDTPVSSRQIYKTLRIPKSILSISTHPDKIQVLAKFLKKFNWLGSQHGPAKIFIRSNSINGNELGEFILKLIELTKSNVEFENINSLDDCTPVTTRLKFSKTINKESEAKANEPSTTINIPQPLQLEYCAGSHPIFLTGNWFIDLSIDRINDNNKFVNLRDKWLLPKKSNLTRLFIKECPTRILKNGQISSFVNFSRKFLEIHNPPDHLIFGFLIWNPTRQNDVALYKDAQLSDKGKYLQQVLEIFGGLNQFIDNTMAKSFWRNQIDSLARFTVTDRDSIITKLKRRVGKVANFKNDNNWENLCDCVIEISKYVKAPKNKFSFDSLRKSKQNELEKIIEISPDLKKQKELFINSQLDEFDETFKFLIEKNIFYRGYEWSCKNCSYRNWANVSGLDEKMVCNVCKSTHKLPLDFYFEFRLNEFFATCVREHDTVSIGWALSNLRSNAKTSFIYTPPLNLYKDFLENKTPPDNEVDVLCIVDGELILAEVKNSLNKIKPKDLENLVKLSLKLKVDKIMIMAIKGNPEKLRELINQIKKELPDFIKIDGAISNWNDDLSSI